MRQMKICAIYLSKCMFAFNPFNRITDKVNSKAIQAMIDWPNRRDARMRSAYYQMPYKRME